MIQLQIDLPNSRFFCLLDPASNEARRAPKPALSGTSLLKTSLLCGGGPYPSVLEELRGLDGAVAVAVAIATAAGKKAVLLADPLGVATSSSNVLLFCDRRFKDAISFSTREETDLCCCCCWCLNLLRAESALTAEWLALLVFACLPRFCERDKYSGPIEECRASGIGLDEFELVDCTLAEARRAKSEETGFSASTCGLEIPSFCMVGSRD